MMLQNHALETLRLFKVLPRRSARGLSALHCNVLAQRLSSGFFAARRGGKNSVERVHILFHFHCFPATSARYNILHARLERGRAAWRSEFFSLTAVLSPGFHAAARRNNRRSRSPRPTRRHARRRAASCRTSACSFLELTDSDISEIHIRAGDDCAFDFSLRGELSVNGQKADGEVFSTLLDQLTADCFVPCEDFEPRGEPLLTVTVSTDTQAFFRPFLSGQRGRQIRLRRRRG